MWSTTAADQSNQSVQSVQSDQIDSTDVIVVVARGGDGNDGDYNSSDDDDDIEFVDLPSGSSDKDQATNDISEVVEVPILQLVMGPEQTVVNDKQVDADSWQQLTFKLSTETIAANGSDRLYTILIDSASKVHLLHCNLPVSRDGLLDTKRGSLIVNFNHLNHLDRLNGQDIIHYTVKLYLQDEGVMGEVEADSYINHDWAADTTTTDYWSHLHPCSYLDYTSFLSS